MAYITLAEMLAYGFPNRETNATDDTEIESIIDEVTQFIDDITGRTFVAGAAANRSFERPLDKWLMLDADLLSVTSITNADGAVLAAASYRLWPLNSSPKYKIELLDESWGTTDDTLVVVKGVWAYSSTPSVSVKLACKILVKAEYMRRTGDTEQGGFVTPSGVTILPSGMPKTAWRILNRLTRGNVQC